jgi:hypothetical protein
VIDSTTQERIIVSSDGTAGPYLVVPLDQLEFVESMLREHQVPFWVDADAVSLNGKPEITVVNFGPGVDASRVQQLLDAAR